MGKVLENVVKPPQDSSLYKCLTVFSGVKPTSSNEDDYDTWIDQAAHMIKTEVDLLKEQLQEVIAQVSSLAVQCQQDFRVRPHQDSPSRNTQSGQQNFYYHQREYYAEVSSRDRIPPRSEGEHESGDSFFSTVRLTFRSFCYCCGQDGHRIRECANPGNANLVAERLQALYAKQLENFRGNQWRRIYTHWLMWPYNRDYSQVRRVTLPCHSRHSDRELTELDLPNTFDAGRGEPPLMLQKVLSLPNPQLPEPDFKQRLQTWLQAEQKTLDDLTGMVGVEAPLSASTSENVVLAMGKVLENVTKPPREQLVQASYSVLWS
ncbi:UNVERIFIED_CONTAM: hypothetical protein FKN15_007174 [Acipenser sinensis]